jgi:hypothetical protein
MFSRRYGSSASIASGHPGIRASGHRLHRTASRLGRLTLNSPSPGPTSHAPFVPHLCHGDFLLSSDLGCRVALPTIRWAHRPPLALPVNASSRRDEARPRFTLLERPIAGCPLCRWRRYVEANMRFVARQKLVCRNVDMLAGCGLRSHLEPAQRTARTSPRQCSHRARSLAGANGRLNRLIPAEGRADSREVPASSTSPHPPLPTPSPHPTPHGPVAGGPGDQMANARSNPFID